MWLKEETFGSDIEMSPAVATVLGIAVVGSIVFGIFPDILFDHAQTASEVLGSPASIVSLR